MRRHQDWMGHTSATHGPRTSYQYRAETLDPPNRLGTVPSGPKKLFGPNGKPFGTVDDQDQEDRELTRKLKELREIEESIRCKKAALACKTELEPAAAADEEADGCSLRDRVAAIFQQRHSGAFLSKSHPHTPRMRSCDPRKDDGPEEDHPLKVRVKALMKHRMGRPRVPPSDTKVLNRTDASFNVPQPPPRRIASPPAGGSGTDQGFQRFLDVLNRGVDVNLLRRIVNGDPEDARLRDEVQDQQRHRAADPPFPIRIQRAEDGISLPERSGSGERSRDPPGSSRIPDENREEALSPSRSKTPPDPPSGIRHQKEDEERIKHDQQHEQLRNILTSLGLQLEVEEISRLADRTQERLYGKKSDVPRRRDAASRRQTRQPEDAETSAE
ncbi:unnamed protein product [Tetraodon nigroviridis]|uniref:(spotted green pufferfish) hypothetical protein n=1 Tax=Tetraodon nigroviridis TaxID=99883 RepID=Q4RZP2_TETNG|nr:unnamed protein product [Tetraodon nigroviridis]